MTLKEPKQPTADAAITPSHLLDSGLEAIRAGAAALIPNASPRALGIALREMSSGLELILKGLLPAEHWSLAFEDPATASLAKFRAGTFQSAGFAQCRQRLYNISGLEISDGQGRSISRLRVMRNKLEHLGVVANENALRAAMGGALHAIADVVKTALLRAIRAP